MKKLLLAIGAMALLIGACSRGNDRMQDSLADLSEQYKEATSFSDSLMLLMGDIYTGLDSINTQEGLLYSLGPGENDRREQIRDNLSNIKARLAANRQLLDDMEKKLNDSDKQNAILMKTISDLKNRVAEQEQKISQLNSQLEAANAQIETLNTTVAETQEQVRTEAAAKEEAQAQAQQADAERIAAEAEANAVYYAIGTNSELKTNGLLEKKFLGSTKVMQGDVNMRYFTKADKRTLTTIPTGAKKVKIWSNMPAGSYEWVENPDGTKTLHILNANRFWEITPYLILQIN